MKESTLSQIKFNDLDIENCFKNFYSVPDYQREFVWEEQQVNQLLNDIYLEFDGNARKDYFIGSTVVYRTDDGIHELIDGQQRTTTLFIILCAFKAIYRERKLDIETIERMLKDKTVDASGDSINRFKLELQYEDSTNILEIIYANASRPEGLVGSSERLYNAYEYILTFLRQTFSMDDQAGLKKFFVFFIRNVKLIQILTPEISDALKIFETINERGVGLNPMDLLKNLIFRQVDRGDFNRLKQEWERLIKLLEGNDEKPLRFLRYFLMANYQINGPKGEEILREDEIYTWISKPASEKQIQYIKKPFEFVKLLNENALYYTMFLSTNDKWGKNVFLDNIKKLSGGAFKQHLILLLSVRHLSKELFDHLVSQLEILMFYYFINNDQAKIFERNFASWAKELQGIKTKERLNSFIKKSFGPEIESREAGVKAKFMILSQRDLQQYRLRYLLAKLSQHVDQERLGSHSVQLLDSYITKGIEIEHILPAKPEADLRKSIGELYDELKVRLGNLTLLEKSINASIGNSDFFKVKRAEYAKSLVYLTKSIVKAEDVGKNTSINRLNKKLIQFDSWDEQQILRRQEMLHGLAKEIWRLKDLD